MAIYAEAARRAASRPSGCQPAPLLTLALNQGMKFALRLKDTPHSVVQRTLIVTPA